MIKEIKLIYSDEKMLGDGKKDVYRVLHQLVMPNGRVLFSYDNYKDKAEVNLEVLNNIN